MLTAELHETENLSTSVDGTLYLEVYETDEVGERHWKTRRRLGFIEDASYDVPDGLEHEYEEHLGEWRDASRPGF